MEWELIKAGWQHYKVLARARWGRISVEDFDLIAGRRELLAGQIHDVYGVSGDAAQMQIESWQAQQREPGTT
jgi:uncharacterized protein YjbJ (UPF0337 family)